MIKLSTQCSKVYACYVWKQWEIWLQNCKMDTKTMQCMWILSTNDAWKKNFGQKHRNWKFFSCDLSNSNQVRQTQTKNFNRDFDLSKNRFDRSKVWKNQIFEKQSILMQKLLKTHCFIKKCISMRRKVFQKHLNSTQIFQNQDFQSICPQSANIKHILH